MKFLSHWQSICYNFKPISRLSLSNEENTVPTGHDKIRVAKVREYKRKEVLETYDKLAELALAVKVEDSVRLMKQVVPEFKSRNSEFEKLDKKE